MVQLRGAHRRCKGRRLRCELPLQPLHQGDIVMPKHASPNSSAISCEMALSFRLHMFASGELKSIEFLDDRDFAVAKHSAMKTVSTCAAEHVEVHDEFVGLVFQYPQMIS